MWTKHLFILIHIWNKGVVFNTFADRSNAVLLLWIIYVISVLLLLCFRECLFIDALWSPAVKGLTSWLSFVMSYCEVVTFPLVSMARCIAWLYRFQILALFLTLVPSNMFKLSSKIYCYWPFKGSASSVDLLCYCLFLAVTCWKMADLLALLYVMFSCVLSLSHMVS